MGQPARRLGNKKTASKNGARKIMNRINYQKELDQIIEKLPGAGEGLAPSVFLHSCCAPCSSYVLEYLSRYFYITVFYFNPNISETGEYQKRAAEQRRLIQGFNEEGKGHTISVVEGDYEPKKFFEAARGLENCPEGGERCFRCFELRLRETAKRAAQAGYDYFATTLTVSPLKNAVKLNEIGETLSREYGIAWLPSDFKKKEGYKRSIELSEQYGLYRQNYCGCVFSQNRK